MAESVSVGGLTAGLATPWYAEQPSAERPGRIDPWHALVRTRRAVPSKARRRMVLFARACRDAWNHVGRVLCAVDFAELAHATAGVRITARGGWRHTSAHGR